MVMRKSNTQTVLNVYKKLAQGLALFFKPVLQVELYDKTDTQCLTFNKVLDAETSAESNSLVNFFEVSGRQYKQQRLDLSEGFYLLLTHDVSVLSDLHAQLKEMFEIDSENKTTKNVTVGNAHIDQLISNYLSKHNVTLAALKPKQKRELVSCLNEEGALKYQDASNYLANKLHVSRATIYNYLSASNQLKSLSIHQVDAFTDQPFSGNPAAVVLDAAKLDEALMKKITREMNLSETAFVMPSDHADIKVRYFTPTGDEMRFCGHSTVSTLYMLAHENRCGLTGPGYYTLTLETCIGIVETHVKIGEDEEVEISFVAPHAPLTSVALSYDALAESLELDLNGIDQTRPLMYEPSNQDLYIPCRNLEGLKTLAPSLKGFKHLATKHNVIAFCFFAPETFSDTSDIHMRVFAPTVGIAEDPFTGSVLGGLGEYVMQNRLLKHKKRKFRVEQGHFMDRPGWVDVSVESGPQHETVTVYAKARHFFSTLMNL